MHLRAEGGGKPLTVVLTPGQQHEATVARRLLRQGAAAAGLAPAAAAPCRSVGDKGYSSRKFRAFLRRRGIRVTIPHKRNEPRTGR